MAYGFLNNYDGNSDLEEWLEQQFGIKLVNPLVSGEGVNAIKLAKIYKTLSYEGKDCVNCSERKQKSRENTERFVDSDDASPKPC